MIEIWYIPHKLLQTHLSFYRFDGENIRLLTRDWVCRHIVNVFLDFSEALDDSF